MKTPIINKEFLAERTSKIMLHSDLLTTRFMVGLSSFIFSAFLMTHYLMTFHPHDLFWIVFSITHAAITFCALYMQKNNWFTFIGEAVMGFILWNYISISLLLLSTNNADFLLGDFTPSMAPFAPTFIAGISTWWILSRYPQITKK